MLGTYVSEHHRPGFKETVESPEMGPFRTALKTAATYASMAKDSATIINVMTALANAPHLAGLLPSGLAT